MEDIRPTSLELNKWLVETLRHSMGVEYYLHALDIGHDDPQRPHDIVGEGNKFSWPVARGLALQLRDHSSKFFEKYVLPSIEYHREHQHHHQMWNNGHKDASVDSMKVGAVDATRSLLEESEFRAYQGGPHSFEEVVDVIKTNQPWKLKWFWMVYSQMKELPEPRTNSIRSLRDFDNIGVSEEMFAQYKKRSRETINEYRERGYDI